MKRMLGVLVAASLLVPLPARAGWKNIGGGSATFIDVSLTPQGEMFLAGFSVDPTSQLPLPTPALFFSEDGGATLEPIGAGLSGGGDGLGGFGTVGAVDFVGAMTGWTTTGDVIHRTGDRGGAWTDATLISDIKDIHFFDTKTGVVVGDDGFIARTDDGGATWETIPSGTQVNLSCMFWLDEQRGFAAGATTKTGTDTEGIDTTTWGVGAVLLTGDGGRTWTTGYETMGLALCPLFFLDDAEHGWLVAREVGEDGGGRAYVYRTDDGGYYFEDMAVPVEVGTLEMFMSLPIATSSFPAMFWADTQRGHLGGSAYVASGSSGMGGSQPVYRTVDFVTTDGGATWEKTDVGTVKVDIASGGQMPPGDGGIGGGVLTSLFEGVMVGEKSGIWIYEHTCKSDEECGPGALCGESSRCETAPAPAEGCPGTTCAQGKGAGGAGGSPAGDATTGGGQADATGSRGILPASGGGGCGIADHTAPPFAMALLLLALGLRRARRP